MSKKGTYGGNFFPPDPSDPLYNILAAGGNMVVGYGLKWVSREIAGLMGFTQVSVERQLALNRSQLQLERQQADTVRAKTLGEMQLRYLDLKIKQKEIEVEERRRHIETALSRQVELNAPSATQVVVGALEVAATPDGLMDSGGQPEGYAAWLDSLQSGKVIAILGRRGSGKSALGGKIAEYAMAVHRMPIYWIGLPQEARKLLPTWISLADSPVRCPVGSFILIDEAGLQYLSLAFNTDHNKFLRALLMICRQRHCSLVFIVQSSRDADLSILRQADTIIFKQPGLNQAESERDFVKAMAKKATIAFAGIPPDQRHESALVFDDDFQGIIRSTLPSFWSEELSHVYAHFDIAGIVEKVKQNNEIQSTITDENRLLDKATIEHNILERRRQGHGIQKIANLVGCTTWKVRQVLDQAEKPQ
jgi:hypothetical protein